MAVEWVEARIEGWREWAPGLRSLRLDGRVGPFRAGQFVNLALDLDGQRVQRSYSLASPPGAPPELLLVEVPGGRLTPALFARRVGDPVLLCPQAAGHFTLELVPSAPLLWLLCSGTGLAPYLSMLRTEEPWARFGRVVLVHAVSARAHLACGEELEALGAAHGGRLTRVPVVSRERDLPPGHLAGRIPALLQSGALEAQAGAVIDPAGSQVLVCGNPGLIAEVRALLEARGLRKNRRREPGQLTTEAYW
jgi:ferredoxin--NADP+ reductase